LALIMQATMPGSHIVLFYKMKDIVLQKSNFSTIKKRLMHQA